MLPDSQRSIILPSGVLVTTRYDEDERDERRVFTLRLEGTPVAVNRAAQRLCTLFDAVTLEVY